MTLAGARILLTGATGFIGRHLARRLLGDGADLTLLVRPETAPAVAAEIGGRARVLAAALGDRAAVGQAVAAAGPEIVYHLGADTDPGRDSARTHTALAANLGGTVDLALAAAEAGVRRFIAAGTCEEYGRSDLPLREDMPLRPLSPYSASKAAATLWLGMMGDTFGFPAVVLRPFLCYGPGQSPPRLVPSAILSALEDRDLPMTEGLQLRELTYVGDVVDGFVRAAAAPAAAGEAVNLGSGEEHRVIDIVTEIYRRVGSRGRPRPGAIPTRPNEMQRFAADTAKADRLLGWRASTDLGTGLDHTIRWSRTHGARPVPLDPDIRTEGEPPAGAGAGA